MGWPGGSPNDAVRDIGTGQRLHPLLDGNRALLVALEPDQAELRLHHPRLDLGYPDGLAEELQPERPGDGAYGVLAGRIPHAAWVNLEAGDRAQVDDVRARGAPEER